MKKCTCRTDNIFSNRDPGFSTKEKGHFLIMNVTVTDKSACDDEGNV